MQPNKTLQVTPKSGAPELCRYMDSPSVKQLRSYPDEISDCGSTFGLLVSMRSGHDDAARDECLIR